MPWFMYVIKKYLKLNQMQDMNTADPFDIWEGKKYIRLMKEIKFVS